MINGALGAVLNEVRSEERSEHAYRGRAEVVCKSGRFSEDGKIVVEMRIEATALP